MKNKIVLNLILLFSIFALLAAYYIEYILGHKPCNLCLIERIPYILTIIVITTYLIIKKFQKVIFLLISFIFFCLTLVSFYHFGIEQGFFIESQVCNLNSETKALTKDQILSELKEKSISCKEVSFKIIGFSLATINTLLSLLISIITLKIYLDYEKNK